MNIENASEIVLSSVDVKLCIEARFPVVSGSWGDKLSMEQGFRDCTEA